MKPKRDGYKDLNKYSATRKKANFNWRLNNPEKGLWHSARSRAKELKLEFDISVEDIKIPEFCPIVGVKLEHCKGMKFRNIAPSLDRLDNSKGYTKDNIAVISYRANRLKSNMTREEITNLFNYVNQLHKGD